MLEGLKRWFGGGKPAPASAHDDVAEWAQRQGWAIRPVREGGGFAVEGRLGALPWRMEWGPSQRPYFEGFELRLRAEPGLPPDLHALVLDRSLQERLERDVFERYVEDVQTRIDSETPPEVRWLVMYTKLAGSELGPLRERWGAVANARPWLGQWLQGPLAEALAAQRADAAARVLVIHRGRLTLRTPLANPEPRELERPLRLFEVALREAQRVAAPGPASVPLDDGDAAGR
jgi:hypothetical protein